MSAYVVNDKTISVIAKGLLNYGIDCDWMKWDPMQTIFVNERYQPLGQSLLNQNIRSVVYRYGYGSQEYKDAFKQQEREFKFENVDYDEGLLLGCIKCYLYQSCETPNFDNDRICIALERLQRRMLERMIEQKGQEIPWGCD